MIWERGSNTDCGDKREPAAGTAGEERASGEDETNHTESPPTTQELIGPPDCRSLMELALRYARAGYPVLPLQPRGKRPATKNGLKDASQDLSQIEQWWAVNSLRNIGILTEKLVVIDVDPVDGHSNPWLESAEAKACFDVVEVVVQTGRGGIHLYFQNTHDIRNSAGKLAPGVDIRGVGGYIVAPGSVHENGTAYLPVHGDIGSTPPESLTELPIQIVEKLTKKTKRKHSDVIPEGRRNNELFKTACRLIRTGTKSEDLLAALSKINAERCKPPLDDDEVEKIAQSAQNQSHHPRAASTEQNVPDSLDIKPLSDLGNAERFAEAAKDRIQWNGDQGAFLHYNGKFWHPDAEAVQAFAKEMIRDSARQECQKVASSNLSEDAREELLRQLKKHFRAAESASRFYAMLRMAKDETGMQICNAEMDSNPFLLNVKNGTIDLTSGNLARYEPKDYFSYALPYEFDPEAPCREWEKCLLEICCGDADLAAFLQRVAGYCLTGSVREQLLFIFWGTGANGKSLVLNTLMSLLGPLAMKSDATVFTSKNKGFAQPGRATPELARMRGKRLVVSAELDIGSHVNESVVKDLTGGDVITARDLFSPFADFAPSHKIILCGNHLPGIRGSDHGVWRRLVIVPFNARFTKELGNVDPNLGEKLKEEMPGILAWAVRGCLAWQAHGLQIPDAIRQATQEYREETDLLVRFIHDRCEVGDTLTATSEVLLKAFNSWAQEMKEHEISYKTLGFKLRESGFESVKVNGRRGWKGLAVRPEFLRHKFCWS